MHPTLIAAVLSVLGSAALAIDCPMPTDWTRTGAPVLRDRIVAENYEVASDAHAFRTSDGQVAMIYTGAGTSGPAIKLARGKDWHNLTPAQILIDATDAPGVPLNKETPFYHQTDAGEHQIYFIAYDDEDSYRSQIYRATSDALTGPYVTQPDPVVGLGEMAGETVRVITSPSVIAHDGMLHIAFLGWNGFHDVTQVWTLGATSVDGGATWNTIRKITAPIGMEGQITAMPNGGYVAAATTELPQGVEGIRIGCADHPFGPYTMEPGAALAKAGSPWEVDEVIAPQITFDQDSGDPLLFYTGADHARGWWVLLAIPTP